MDYTGIIYCYTSPSGKCYIGQTIRAPKIRRYEHNLRARKKTGYAFHRALCKYGIENFEYSELAIIHSKDKKFLMEMLNSLEKSYIHQYKKDGIVLYNLTEGGDFYFSHKGEHLSDKRKRENSAWTKNWHSTLSNEQRLLYSKAISQGRKKPILQYTLESEFIREWESASDVPFAKQNAINMCLRGKNRTCAGFIWRYKDE